MTIEKGRLYVVATPIGNPRDITLRALDVLKEVDAVICEEQREGSTLLKKLGIDKPIVLLNEHNEAERAPDLAIRIHKGEALALISDCGTPVFADPGASLIARLVEMGVPVTPVPGPSSLMAALSVLDMPMERFLYAGFLPRDKTERRNALRGLRQMRQPFVLLDAPYRLVQVLEDISSIIGGKTRLTLCMDLTLPSELILRGTVDEVRQRVGQRKSEFVLIVH
ncbi:MAG: 16S rRNA (cytidine(1402)-2'-O)-methyltransferase [Anaerolineae bacterium]|nr:16S rRNA (cytidine(1402)-2'-O)-methyltransferase [Anaerolineae bacterium]